MTLTTCHSNTRGACFCPSYLRAAEHLEYGLQVAFLHALIAQHDHSALAPEGPPVLRVLRLLCHRRQPPMGAHGEEHLLLRLREPSEHLAEERCLPLDTLGEWEDARDGRCLCGDRRHGGDVRASRLGVEIGDAALFDAELVDKPADSAPALRGPHQIISTLDDHPNLRAASQRKEALRGGGRHGFGGGRSAAPLHVGVEKVLQQTRPPRGVAHPAVDCDEGEEREAVNVRHGA